MSIKTITKYICDYCGKEHELFERNITTQHPNLEMKIVVQTYRLSLSTAYQKMDYKDAHLCESCFKTLFGVLADKIAFEDKK